MCSDKEGWLRCRASAARRKVFARATAKKTSNCLNE